MLPVRNHFTSISHMALCIIRQYQVTAWYHEVSAQLLPKRQSPDWKTAWCATDWATAFNIHVYTGCTNRPLGGYLYLMDYVIPV